MTGPRFLRRLSRDTKGAAIIEFALLAPALIVMLVGVLQVGVALQSYNALRNVSADVARYAMVQYATGNKLSNQQLSTHATAVAREAPYLLNSTLRVTVTNVATPQVSGTTEKTLSIDYEIPSLLATMGVSAPTINYTRPLFLAR